MEQINYNQEKIGALFREVRQKKGLSLRAAAADIISKSQLSRFELGESDISLTCFLALLDQINFSIQEFIEILRVYQDERSTYLFEKAGLLEKDGKISEIQSLYDKEIANYQKTNKIEHKLNSIALKSILCHYGEFKFLTQNQKETLIEYFMAIESWSRYDLYLFLFTLSNLPLNFVQELVDEILSQRDFYAERVDNQSLILMLLRNLISIMVDHRDFQKAEKILEKFKEVGKSHWTISVGMTYEVIRAKLFEAKKDYNQAINILEKLVVTYESFGSLAEANRYKAELEQMKQQLKS